jgi:PIN domain nuclease of toxin-antitoxin system
MRYLLDTHAVIWLLSSQDGKLPADIRESIRYCEDSFFLSEITLVEIIQLQQKERIAFNYRPNTTRAIIEENNIMLLPASGDILECFFDMTIPVIKGKPHSDPFDRIIIATAIRRGMTLVSADTKFPWYRDNCGLHLLEI